MSDTRLAVSISAHAWNGDRTLLALCPNTHELRIYRRNGDDYDLLHTLTKHDAIITSIAWAPNTDKILSCSQDRNAYVWENDGTSWNPTLVILRINRAATYCAWSPREDKFAVATGDQVVAICYFEEDNNWFVSKHIKKGITSTVLTLDWHPNNVLIAAGGSDKEVRVFSGFVKGVDNRKDFADGTAFGKKLPFGALLGQYPMNGWIQSCKWSPSGSQLAWTCHDSSVHVMETQQEGHNPIQSVYHNYLPFRDMIWVNEGSIIGAGHDCFPVLFQNQGGHWAHVGKLDNKQVQQKSSNARQIWQDRTARGEENTSDLDLPSRHQNCITVLQVIDNNSFSSSGLDGNVVVWSYGAIQSECG